MNYKERDRQRLRLKRQRTVRRNKILLLIGLILFMLISIKVVDVVSDYRAAVKAERAAEEKARKEREAIEAEEKLIAEVLSTDKYGKELEALYKEYPQVKEILINRDAYEDWIIEYLIEANAAIDWVVEYPEYMEKSKEELDKIALAPIDVAAESNGRNYIPMLFQWDQRWGYSEYGESYIALDGCGPVCVSMVASGLKNDGSITPRAIADFCTENMLYVDGQGTSWELMETGAAKFGLKSEQLMEWSTTTMRKCLSEGKPIICSVGPGDFTTQGHFIVIVKLNEDGTVMVNDPNSPENSEKNWNLQQILDQTKGMWAFSPL